MCFLINRDYTKGGNGQSQVFNGPASGSTMKDAGDNYISPAQQQWNSGYGKNAAEAVFSWTPKPGDVDQTVCYKATSKRKGALTPKNTNGEDAGSFTFYFNFKLPVSFLALRLFFILVLQF